MTKAFWANALAEELSQGDLLVGAWIGSQFLPRTGLAKGPTQKGGGASWLESTQWKPDAGGQGHYLARGRDAFALVLSHGCEMDKKGGKAPVLVAPLVDLEAVVPDETMRETIRSGRRHAFFPLDRIDGALPESYVDLRAISYMPRNVIDGLARVASAAPAGAERLAAHIIGFLTRVPLSDLKSAAEAAAAADEPQPD